MMHKLKAQQAILALEEAFMQCLDAHDGSCRVAYVARELDLIDAWGRDEGQACATAIARSLERKEYIEIKRDGIDQLHAHVKTQ